MQSLQTYDLIYFLFESDRIKKCPGVFLLISTSQKEKLRLNRLVHMEKPYLWFSPASAEAVEYPALTKKLNSTTLAILNNCLRFQSNTLAGFLMLQFTLALEYLLARLLVFYLGFLLTERDSLSLKIPI